VRGGKASARCISTQGAWGKQSLVGTLRGKPELLKKGKKRKAKKNWLSKLQNGKKNFITATLTEGGKGAGE